MSESIKKPTGETINRRPRTGNYNPKYKFNKFNRRKRFCKFCAMGVQHVDYKDVEMLANYINFNKKIVPAKQSYNCAAHQRRVSIAIKRARIVGLMPYIAD